MFFVAKRKTKRKSPAKPQARRKKTPFVGDQILGLYSMFACCLQLGFLLGLAAIGMNLTFAKPLQDELPKYISDKELLTRVNDLLPSIGLTMSVLSIILFFFSIWYIRSIWQGRKWAIWLTILLNLPWAGIVIILGATDSKFGSILPVVVSFYCILRAAGSVGPKM